MEKKASYRARLPKEKIELEWLDEPDDEAYKRLWLYTLTHIKPADEEGSERPDIDRGGLSDRPSE